MTQLMRDRKTLVRADRSRPTVVSHQYHLPAPPGPHQCAASSTVCLLDSEADSQLATERRQLERQLAVGCDLRSDPVEMRDQRLVLFALAFSPMNDLIDGASPG